MADRTFKLNDIHSDMIFTVTGMIVPVNDTMFLVTADQQDIPSD